MSANARKARPAILLAAIAIFGLPAAVPSVADLHAQVQANEGQIPFALRSHPHGPPLQLVVLVPATDAVAHGV